MYTLLHKSGLRSALTLEGPAFLGAWILAEAFYKFGSFTLESGAFLVTWYIGGLISHRIAGK